MALGPALPDLRRLFHRFDLFDIIMTKNDVDRVATREPIRTPVATRLLRWPKHPRSVRHYRGNDLFDPALFDKSAAAP
jgi:hypothetical protein